MNASTALVTMVQDLVAGINNETYMTGTRQEVIALAKYLVAEGWSK